MVEHKVIYASSSTELILIDTEDEVKLKLIKYPLRGYANNYQRILEVANDYIRVYQVCDTYAIPPCTSMNDVVTIAEIYDVDFALKLKEALKQVKNISDFEKLIKVIEEEEKKKNEEAEDEFDKIIQKLTDLADD